MHLELWDTAHRDSESSGAAPFVVLLEDFVCCFFFACLDFLFAMDRSGASCANEAVMRGSRGVGEGGMWTRRTRGARRRKPVYRPLPAVSHGRVCHRRALD